MLTDRNPERADVTAANGVHLHIAQALYIWESGDFLDWAEENGFPLVIGGQRFDDWDGIETALVNFAQGPYDPRELD